MIVDRLQKGDRQTDYYHIARNLFSKGYSLEQIYKRLVEKHRCCSRDARYVVTRMAAWDKSYNDSPIFNAIIEDIVCVRDGYAVSAATADLEPHFLINLDLPIYFWKSDTSTPCFFIDSWWGGGKVVFMNNKICKFVSDNALNKQRGSNYAENEDEYTKTKLKIWPNERVTYIVGEVVKMHMNSGMEDCSFRIHGWSNLHYTIEVRHE